MKIACHFFLAKSPLVLSICLLLCCFSHLHAQNKPNILIIYADDLGIGDVSAYGKGKLATPNIDKLAQGGLRFSNAYATSATCTPSRYALLTGQYPWRNPRAKILTGDAPALLDTAQKTVADLLKTQGYRTGVVGKWHLGLGNGNMDWNQPIPQNPNDLGFDYSFIMAATTDRVPTVYIENRRVLGLSTQDPLQVSYEKNFPSEPTALTNPELLTKQKWHHGHNQSVHNGIPRIGFMRGGKAALWQDETMGDVFVEKALNFIGSDATQPFFLYFALHQPHVPRVPHPRFVGKSGMGPRGDAILELDWCVGEILQHLQNKGLLENTLILFSSDNGPVLNDGYYDAAVEKVGNHDPFGGLRGGKYSLFEGGAKVPFIVHWPAKVRPGISDALVCQLDLYASLAALLKLKIPAMDSQNQLVALLGKDKKGRKELVLEASGRLAYRSGPYAFIPPYQGMAVHKEVNIELGVAPSAQLYDLRSDPGQKNNLAASQGQLLTKLRSAMQKAVGTYQTINEDIQLK